MTVVLKANELNTLIYKYLLEAGLSHTAYTLFNEAALAQHLQQLQFDVRSGHLLALLEKALIYSHIEAHCGFSEYKECREPFQLLKPHTCKIVDAVRKEREETMKELDEQLNDSIKRTNSIYNAAIVNREFEDIVYEPKGKKYFEKFAKIRLPATDPDTDTSGKFTLAGTETHTLLYNADDYEIDLLKYDSINEEVTVDRIFPCVRQGELARSIAEGVAGDHLVQLFQDNHVTIFDLRNEELTPIEFNLSQPKRLNLIDPNPNIPQLVAFKSEESFCVININTLRVVRKGEGKFYWRSFDEYLLLSNEQTQLWSLLQPNAQLIYEGGMRWEEIYFNASRNLFAGVSYSSRIMQVFTFQNPKPLFLFAFEDKVLREVLFVTSNSVDYLCWLTGDSIKVFDLSLNSYSKTIDLQDYDCQVQQICALRKADKDELYLLALSSDTLLVYDISHSKIERVEMEGRVSLLKPLSLSRVALVTEANVYFLVGQYVDPLFK